MSARAFVMAGTGCMRHDLDMVGKIAGSLRDAAAEVRYAGGDGHHLTIGPGEPAVGEWLANGLTLPDLPEMRRYRVDRIVQQLQSQGYDGIIVMDPMNIRYSTDATNMQVWVMHNGARYAWIGADGHVILWDYYGCEYLTAHSDVVDEVRPAIGSTYFLAGPRHHEQAKRWTEEMLAVIRRRCGLTPRVAIDQCHHVGYRLLEDAGVELGFGQEVMELARSIKGPDEILAMRCAIDACETTMAEMYAALEPGMTEREVWAMLHAGNIRRGGEWIETQIIASGPRTNPWMQEASSRVIEAGDILAYDTDLVGAYGMMVDISRTWICGDGKGEAGAPTGAQQHVFDLAREQIERNTELMTPGRSFRELTFDSWFPPTDTYRHYSCLFHGVGQCDEYPEIYFPEIWDDWGFDGELQEGMVLTVESFVGPIGQAGGAEHAGEGVKLENQVLVTADGPELLTRFPLELQLAEPTRDRSGPLQVTPRDQTDQMSELPEVPQFGALLREHIASVPAEGRPAYLSGLERSAASRYRAWADAVPEHAEALTGCADREDEIADLIAESFPVSAEIQAAVGASLPAAIQLYYDVFEPYSVLDQLYLQSEAELQGAQAWVAMAAGVDDAATLAVLERCTALEQESSAVVKQLLSSVAV